MVGEFVAVRYLFKSCEGPLNERVSLSWYKRTNHEVICLLYECIYLTIIP